MHYQELIDRLHPELVQRLRNAVETGRWPDGREVTAEQREHSLQAIIAWESARLPEEERTGFIDRSRKERAPQAADTQELRWAGNAAADDDADDGGDAG